MMIEAITLPAVRGILDPLPAGEEVQDIFERHARLYALKLRQMLDEVSQTEQTMELTEFARKAKMYMHGHRDPMLLPMIRGIALGTVLHVSPDLSEESIQKLAGMLSE